MLGWNIQYGFNDSDFEVSENLLSIYLDEYEETPWDALKYLVSLVLRGQSGLTGLSPSQTSNFVHKTNQTERIVERIAVIGVEPAVKYSSV